MFEINEEFSISMVGSLLHRVRFLLNKINQEVTNEFNCDIFEWEYDKDADTALLHSFAGDTIFYSEKFLSDSPKFFTDDIQFTELGKLGECNNLFHFTEVEMKISEYLIKLEREMLEKEAFKFEFDRRECKPGQETLGEFIAKQEPLGDKFNEVLFSNLNNLYETDKPSNE